MSTSESNIELKLNVGATHSKLIKIISETNNDELMETFLEYEKLRSELLASTLAINISSNPAFAVSCRICDAKFNDEYDLEAHMNFNHK